jgi:hypothetical protein
MPSVGVVAHGARALNARSSLPGSSDTGPLNKFNGGLNQTSNLTIDQQMRRSELELLKAALQSFLQEACAILSKVNIPVSLRQCVTFKDDDVIGWHWETHNEQSPDLYKLAWFFMWQTPSIFSGDLLLQVLRDNPKFVAKYHPEIDNPDDWPGGRYLKNDVWNALLSPYLEKCLSRNGQVIFDQDIFDQVFIDTIADVESPHASIETHLIPLGNLFISQEEPIDLEPGFRLRQLTSEEIEKWLNPTWMLSTKLRVDEFFGLQSAIEITYTHSREDFSIERSVERIKASLESSEKELNKVEKLLGLLRLMTNQSVYIALTQKSTRGFLSRNLSIELPQTPRPHKSHLTRAVIDPNSSERIIELWNALQGGVSAKNFDLAFRRWSGATDRLDEVDRLIDYWIGLEALFMPDMEGELSFRVSLRVAAFLGSTPDQWEKIYKEIRHSYKWRSSVVHGSSVNKKRDLDKEGTLREITIKTKEYLRSALLRLIDPRQGAKQQPGESELEFLRRLGTN